MYIYSFISLVAYIARVFNTDAVSGTCVINQYIMHILENFISTYTDFIL